AAAAVRGAAGAAGPKSEDAEQPVVRLAGIPPRPIDRDRCRIRDGERAGAAAETGRVTGRARVAARADRRDAGEAIGPAQRDVDAAGIVDHHARGLAPGAGRAGNDLVPAAAIAPDRRSEERGTA